MLSISTEIITRLFDLHPIEHQSEIGYEIFGKFCSSVNKLIRAGIMYHDTLFERDSLTSVKNFYNVITQNQDLKEQLREIGIRERLVRCASQYAYFAIRNTKQIVLLCSSIAEVLSKTSSWLDYPTQYWQYWDFSIKQRKFRNNLSTKIVEEIKQKHTSCYPKRKELLNYTIIQNYFRHIKKHLLSNLDEKITNTQISLNIPKNILTKHYDEDYTRKLIAKFCTNISTILTRHFKKIKRESSTIISGKHENTKSLAKIIYQICGTRQIDNVDLEDWQLKKQLWMIHYRDVIENYISKKIILDYLEKSSVQLRRINKDTLLNEFLYPKRFRLFQEIIGNPKKDFIKFLERIIKYHMTRLLVEQQLKSFLPEVREFLLEFIKKPLDYLKTPHFSKASIPLGPDDNQVYKLKELYQDIEITFSFYPNTKHKYKLAHPERYFEQRKEGAIPSRGVLMAFGGKYQLALPFSKRLPEMPKKKPIEYQKILNCDLGLKTFATLSVTVKGFEKDRRFLDQKQLSSPKHRWFLPYDNQIQNSNKQCFKQVNYKMKLVKQRKKMDLLQKELANIRENNKNYRKKKLSHPKYDNTVEYWYKRRELKTTIRKIQNIHKELVHQLSTRIVEYAKFNQVDTIRFEDLRWSKHSQRRDTSFFISTWQIHWFFSRIIQLSASIARRNGIRTEIANPYKTSKVCSTCGKEGSRKGKNFRCTNHLCRLQLDSDLNAARNIGNVSRKCYPVKL